MGVYSEQRLKLLMCERGCCLLENHHGIAASAFKWPVGDLWQRWPLPHASAALEKSLRKHKQILVPDMTSLVALVTRVSLTPQGLSFVHSLEKTPVALPKT